MKERKKRRCENLVYMHTSATNTCSLNNAHIIKA